jgi:hypothetical protein
MPRRMVISWHHAREVSKDVVTGRVHHLSPVLFDQGEHHLLVSFKGPHGCRFIPAQKAAAPLHIRTEDGRQATSELVCTHGITPKEKGLQRGPKVPWRLHFQNLGEACFHSHLWKITIVLKVHRATELYDN